MQPTRTLYPMAYHLTFLPYGCRLPGDPRGWQHRGGDGTPRAPSPRIHRWNYERLQHPPVRLTASQIDIAHRSIVGSCAHRGWALHGLTVQHDHTHVVLSAALPPERVLQYLKSWATRDLRAQGHYREARPLWAEHGSTRYLHTWHAVECTVRYVNDRHHRPSGSL